MDRQAVIEYLLKNGPTDAGTLINAAVSTEDVKETIQRYEQRKKGVCDDETMCVDAARYVLSWTAASEFKGKTEACKTMKEVGFCKPYNESFVPVADEFKGLMRTLVSEGNIVKISVNSVPTYSVS